MVPCDQAQIAHWELGDYGPRLGSALVLARALGVHVEDLGLDGNAGPAS
jgi:DNA-binding XRE family transcriptional regulator